MGKSSSVTVGHKYLVGGHLVFCHGPIDSIDTIEWDTRAGWRGLATGGTITVDAENLFGGSKEASTTPGFGGGDNSDADGVSGEIDILMGGPTQTQNSYLQSILGELIPAFRGVVSFVLKQLYVGNSPSLRPLAAWGTRIHVKDDGQPQWYGEKAEIGSTSTVFAKDLYWDFIQYPLAAGSIIDHTIPETGWVSSQGPFSNNTYSDDPADGPKGNTSWATFGHIWLRKEVYIPSNQVLRLLIQIENGCVVFVDGVEALSNNPLNTQPNPSPNSILIIGPYSSGRTVTIHIHGFDEFLEPGFGDQAWLVISGVFENLQKDINPAHFLRECYTSTVWGLKRPEYEINDASFIAAADQLFDEEMGISLLWDRQQPINELIDEIKRHINADIYIDKEGLVTLKLIRDDYIYEDLPVYDESNIIRIERIASTPERELINAVTVVYWDAATGKDASVQIPHAALVQMTGRINPTTIRYDFFTNADIATRAGERDLRVITSSLQTYQVVTDRSSEELNIGDRFILNRPDIGAHNMVVRIIDADLGNGVNNEISLTVTQEVFSLPAMPVMATSPDAAWQNPVQPAAPAPARLVFEQPYYELVQYRGQTEVDALLAADNTLAMLGVAAIRPTGTSQDALIIVDDGAGYHEAEVLDYCPSAVLATAMNYTTKNITFTDEVDLDLVSTGTHCQIDDELLVVEALDLVSRTATLGRGVLDTVPAKEHLVGARIWFWDYYSASDAVTYSDGENVDVKILTNSSLGRLPTSSAPVNSIEFVGRAARPYPPGRLLINGSAYPASIGATDGLSLSWAHRDRLLQTAGTLQDTTVGDIGPEPGTTYTLRIYTALNALLKTVAAIATNVYSYTTSAEEADMGDIGGGLAIDPNWDKTVFLAKINGANASTIFVDSSPNFATPNGDVHVTTSQLLFGSSVATFDGAGDYLNLPYEPNYNLGSANFTIEYWFRPVSVSVGQVHFDWRDAAAAKGVVIYQSSANPNKLTASVGDSNTAAYEVSITGTTTLVVGTLYHARFVKNGTNWQLYLNGATQGGATSSVVPYLNSAAIFFGAARDVSNAFNGQGADLRVTKAARNTSGFTAPSTRLGKYERQANHSDFKVLLTFEGANNDTTIKDQSDLALPVTFYGNAKITTSQFKFGSSCLDLDGSYNSMVWVGDHPSQRGSGSNITIDCWIRTSDVTRAGTIASTGLPSTSNRAGWLIGMTNTGLLFAQGFDDVGGEAFTILAATAISVNTWYHVELVRNGTTWTLYQGGVSIGSATELAVLGISNSVMSIGRDQYTLITWLGQIDEFAIRDFAVDTATFTPPAASYYPIDPYWSDVVVLMPMSGADNSTQFENIAEIVKLASVVAGNAVISTMQSKFGGSSAYFDGSGDYFAFTHIANRWALLSDFTIQCWIYPTATPVSKNIMSKGFAAGSIYPHWSIATDGTGKILAQLGRSQASASRHLLYSTSTPAINAWTHVAFVRIGNTLKLFVNGVQEGADVTVSITPLDSAAAGLYLGNAAGAAAGDSWLGYIDDIGVINGYCKYTDDFTPPSQELSKYVPALNSQLRFELESVRDGLVSYQKHNVIVVRA